MKFLRFLIAPIFSLYSTAFYRKKLNESLKYGFFYLFYIAGIGACTFLLVFQLRALPVLNEFVDWFTKEMPEVTIDQGKMTSNNVQPFSMVHPRFGNILILDTQRDSLKPDEIKQTTVYVTSTIIYVHNPVQNETQTIDLKQLYEAALKKGKPFKAEIINGESIRRMYEQIKPLISTLFFFGALIYLFIWKLSAAFLYSAIAIIFNLFGEKKYPYPALLNVTIYAMTAVCVLQAASLVTQSLRFDVLPGIAIGITTAYLGLVFFVANPPQELEEKDSSE